MEQSFEVKAEVRPERDNAGAKYYSPPLRLSASDVIDGSTSDHSVFGLEDTLKNRENSGVAVLSEGKERTVSDSHVETSAGAVEHGMSVFVSPLSDILTPYYEQFVLKGTASGRKIHKFPPRPHHPRASFYILSQSNQSAKASPSSLLFLIHPSYLHRYRIIYVDPRLTIKSFGNLSSHSPLLPFRPRPQEAYRQQDSLELGPTSARGVSRKRSRTRTIRTTSKSPARSIRSSYSARKLVGRFRYRWD